MGELGYDNHYQVLNAKDYGIPQNRERVFTISIRKDLNQEFIFPEKQELKLKLKDMLEDKVDEKYYLSSKMMDYITSEDDTYKVNQNSLVVNRDIAVTKSTREGSTRADSSDYICESMGENAKLPGAYGRDFGSKGKILNDDICCTLLTAMGTGGGNIPLVKTSSGVINQKYEKFIKEKGYIPEMFNPYNESEIKDIAPTQTTQCGNTDSSATILKAEGIDFKTKNKRIIDLANKTDISKDDTLYMDIYNQKTIDNQAGTLKAGMDGQQGNIICDQLRIRKLTPKECWRLMGFKDDEFEKAEKVNSNAQLYKQAGNSIVVNVLEEIFKNLLGGKDESSYNTDEITKFE